MISVTASAQEPNVEPRFTGIAQLYVDLNISSVGRANCYTRVTPKDNHSVDVTMELQRDGTTIKTWTASGSELFAIDKFYYVTPNHDYQVVVTAEVRNANNVLIETASVESDVCFY
jgi:hypothetical protein